MPLAFPPGFLLTESPLAARGRYIGGTGVRFFKGKAEKRQGFQKLPMPILKGVPRGSFAWNDLTLRELIGVGTYLKLYAVSDVDYSVQDITPIVQTVAGTNLFSTLGGSAIVTVAITTAFLVQGQILNVSGATSFNNVNVNGSWPIASIVDSGHVTILMSTIATASGSGGGATTIQIELLPGQQSSAGFTGWGIGPWGQGAWGSGIAGNFLSQQPRVWTIGNFGKIGIFSFNGGGIYFWDPTAPAGTRAAPIAAAPTSCSGIVTTSDNIVIAFGSNYVSPGVFGAVDPLQFYSSAQGDYTNWDTTAIAGPRGAPAAVNRLNAGNIIIAAADLGIHITLMWTDYSIHALQYTGSQFVFDTQLVGTQCGIIGPMAFCLVGQVAYWMGTEGFFLYHGGVAPVPMQEDVKGAVFAALDRSNSYKTICWYDQYYHQIHWCIPTTGNNEPSLMVIFDIALGYWYTDVPPVPRSSAAQLSSPIPNPLFFGSDGFFYQDNIGLDADINPLPWSLSFAPVEQDNGAAWLETDGIVLDMQRQAGSVTATITATDRTQPGNVAVEVGSNTADSATSVLDMRVAGRQLALTLSGSSLSCDFRMGIPKLLAMETGERR